MQDIKKTFDCLDSYFLNTDNNTFNQDYFNEYFEIELCNDRNIIIPICEDKRRRVHSLVYAGIIAHINIMLENEYYPKKYYCSSYHLKKYFERFNTDYKSALADLISYFETERKEYIKG